MSDDDPVETFVEGTVEPFDEEGEAYDGPRARDMEAELRDRTGVDAGDPEAEDLDEIDSDTATAFWIAVILVNAGVLLVALGPTVYAIRSLPLVSAALVVGGLLAFYRAYSVYRAFDADDDAEEDGAEGEDGAEQDDATETDRS